MIEHPSDVRQRVRVGLIGLGRIAQTVHLQNLHTLNDRFEVVHVCDVAENLAQRVAERIGNGVRHSDHSDKLLADEHVEAVLILTPGTHASLVYDALRAGRHVLVEKPLAASADEARRLGVVATAAGCVLQVGYMKMYDPMIDRARAHLDDIGDLALIRVTVLHPANEVLYAHQLATRSDMPARVKPQVSAHVLAELERAVAPHREPYVSFYRTVLLASVSHELSVLRALFGLAPIELLHAQVGAATRAAMLSGHPLPAPPQLQVAGTLGNSQLALSWNWLPDYPEYTEEIALFGQRGRMYLTFPGPYLRDHRAALRIDMLTGADRSEQVLRSDHLTSFMHELLAFHRAIVDGEPVRSDAAGAAYDAEVLARLVHVLAAQNLSQANTSA